jgi:hypothetical protein
MNTKILTLKDLKDINNKKQIINERGIDDNKDNEEHKDLSRDELFLDTLKASLPTSKYVPWQLLLNDNDDLPLETDNSRTEYRIILKNAILDSVLSDTVIVESFVVPLLSWIIDPNWPVCDVILCFVKWLLVCRPVLVALAIEHIISAVLSGLEKGLSQDLASKDVVEISETNGGTGTVEIGMLLVCIHQYASAEKCNDVFASRHKLRDLVVRVARLESEARESSPVISLIDDWDYWYDANDSHVFINVFGILR